MKERNTNKQDKNIIISKGQEMKSTNKRLIYHKIKFKHYKIQRKRARA